MTDRYISDELWTALAPVLPGKEGDPGCTGRDNRLFLEAVFWIAKTGSPWRNLPGEFGKWYTTYTRFNRWAKKGVWPNVIAAMEEQGVTDFSFDHSGLHWTPFRGAPARDQVMEASGDHAAAA
ncbi:transposase [Methylocystis sp. WRRC1]|uniref:transposase n=1 Tax=unclassified Methylocystis TaxID=2625913 RepID=UPI0001F8682C|nr:MULTISPECIES: transposase [unclassified Methylocystis]MCC3246202.1 transposase [Methylocystis sp. WRRC1]